MKTSIIIPTYNHAQYLPEAIESALAQTVKSEVIVIDDGSTDNTQDILKQYPQVKVVTQVNKGLASARNTGVMNASGDYILPLDADDILLEQCVEKIQDTALSTKSDVIAPSFKVFGVQDGEVVMNEIPTLEQFKEANRLPYFSAIKKEVLLEIGGYNPKMIFGWEDYDLWIDIFKRGHSIALITDTLVLYRTKENSMYTNSVKYGQQLKQQMVLNHPEVFQ